MHHHRRIAVSAAFAAAAVVLGAASAASAAPASVHHTSAGAVYVLGNQLTGNTVLSYERGTDGTLRHLRQYPTGGLGTGAGLGSQNAIVVDEGGRHLYAVNAGSDTITSFDITRSGLRINSTVPSGGDQPISVSVRGDRLYALNAGGDGNVEGFTVRDGHLSPLHGSTRPLSGTATNPAQVSIAPDGRHLVVTEKATNLLTVYRLDRNGRAISRKSTPSAGATPFGFDFSGTGQLAVSEAGPSAVSTYTIGSGGLHTINASVPNTEAAACWVVITDNGRFLYTGNGGGSQSISGYRLGRHGQLSLLTPDGRTGTAAGGVSDLALSHGSHFLYARIGDGTVSGYRVGADGSLAPLTAVPGLPAGAVGIAAV